MKFLTPVPTLIVGILLGMYVVPKVMAKVGG